MGTITDSAGRLCCDKCGQSGGVRKRTCPYKVRCDSLRSMYGQRPVLSYCSPWALCSPCFKVLGGLRGVHGDSCRDGAAQSQAEYDAIELALEAGELFVVSASTTPEGMVAVTFWGRYDPETRSRPEQKHIVPKSVYDFQDKPKRDRLSDYADVLSA